MQFQAIDTNTMYRNNKKISDAVNCNLLTGKKCFIIAGGPSLVNLPSNYIINKFTIGINRSYETYNTDLLYCMDSELYDRITNLNLGIESLNKFKSFPGLKVFLALSADVRYEHAVHVVNRLYREHISLDVSEGIFTGDNSGFGAIMLAISLGCKDINLLGYDLKADNKTHYHSGYSGQKLEDFKVALHKFKATIEHWAPRFKTAGVRVTQLYINSTDESSLTCFEKKSIFEV